MRLRTAPVLMLLCVAASSAFAQDVDHAPRDRLIRDPYVTRSGATVDKPGEPQGSAPTPLDRHLRTRDNSIDGSICKGC